MSANRILSIYTARRTILGHLEKLGYAITDYIGFNINEVDAMVRNGQLDMLPLHSSNGTKLYVKFLCGTRSNTKLASPKAVIEIIEDLYVNDAVLERSDTLVIVMDGEPNGPLVEKLKYLYDNSGYFLVVHNIERLQFNIMEHQLVPPTRVISDAETAAMLKKYNIQSPKLIPEISRFDPVALAICMRPGQVCEIVRPSPTAMEKTVYRVCV